MVKKLFFASLIISFCCLTLSAEAVRSGYKVYSPSVSYSTVYTCSDNGEDFNYSHCASIEWFDGKFYVVWNANRRTWDEGEPGQELALSVSEDFVNWSEPVNFVGEGFSINPIIDPDGKQWQPNLLNYNGQELWCTWMHGGSEAEPLKYGGTYFSKLTETGGLWENKKLNRLADLYGDRPGVWATQNPILLSSGRVVAPFVFQGAEILPPEWKPQKPKWVGAYYTDDGGETWNVSNVANIPYSIGAAWEPTVSETAGGELIMFFRNITTWRTPSPDKRMFVAKGIGLQKGSEMLFEYDGQYSRIETAHCRHQIMKTDQGRWCMVRHDLYAPSKAFSARRNGALFFSRTGEDDFVASIAFMPTERGVCAYPQGVTYHGKIYVVYTKRQPSDILAPGEIEAAVIDPAPNESDYYIWVRDKDYLLLENESIRANPDYQYTRPYEQSIDNRNALVFKDRGTAGLETDGFDFDNGDALRVSFDVNLSDIDSGANTILCSFGDKDPIRIGFVGGENSLSAYTGYGWRKVGDFSFGQWHNISVVFGRHSFAVSLDGSDYVKFKNPVTSPSRRFYFGDGYEVDETLSNQEAIFYVDVDSVQTQIVEGISQAMVSFDEQLQPVLDASGRKFAVSSTSNTIDVLLSRADIYLPFEGEDNGLGSQCWANYGITAFGEPASRAGSSNMPTVSSFGIKGGCYDGSALTPLSSSGCYMWGEFTSDTQMEEALTEVYSFTVSGWFNLTDDTANVQGRFFSSPAIELNFIRGNVGQQSEFGRIAVRLGSGSFINSPNSEKFACSDNWVFLAISYDGSLDSEQMSFYAGSELQPVSLVGKIDYDAGVIPYSGYGGNLWFGNTANHTTGNRPLVGKADEFRIWSGKSSDISASLSLGELEQIRKYDVSNSDYTFIPPPQGQTAGGLFEAQRVQQIELPQVNFAEAEALKVAFSVKVNQTQQFGNTVIASYGGEKLPIRLLIPGDRQGKIYVESQNGFEPVGDFELDRWYDVEIIFGKEAFSVALDSGEPQAFTVDRRVLVNDFRFGDGWLNDYIVSNVDGVFEIDALSITADVIKPDIIEAIYASEDYRIFVDECGDFILPDESGFDVATTLGASEKPYSVYYGVGGYPYNPYIKPVASADIYLPFDGINSGITSDCWKNRGKIAYNESPTLIGTTGESSPSISSDAVRGTSWDGSLMREYRLNNTYRWGYANREDTYFEDAIKNMSSFTITMWLKQHSSTADSYLLHIPEILTLRHYGNWGNSYIRAYLGAEDYVGSSNVYGCVDKWVFVAITYDGTSSTDNLCFYYGDQANPITLDKKITVDAGQLVESSLYGAPLFIGNTNISGERPFIGKIDELRIWAEKASNSGVLDIDMLEAQRIWDVQGCEQIRNQDINADCMVDMVDLSILASMWQLDGDYAADVNLDGVVDFDDILIFVQSWLTDNQRD